MLSNEHFRVDSLDHVELLVPDRYEAAAWYQKVFGLEIVKQLESWCEPNHGPLMVSSDGGKTMLALLRGEPQAEHPEAGPTVIAFRVSGEKFLQFIDASSTLELAPGETIALTRDDISNHEHSYSVYFSDPWGNRFCVTTYDVKVVYDATAPPLDRGFAG